MDAEGSRLLAARIRAGVRIGARIEIDHDLDTSGLRAGDRGYVRDILETGGVVVDWDDGRTVEIDPALVSFRRLAFASPS